MQKPLPNIVSYLLVRTKNRVLEKQVPELPYTQSNAGGCQW
ncbi:hypothetical protein [Sporosarcina ureae]|nr:hypothetical protein [Sporosarcina ureae]